MRNVLSGGSSETSSLLEAASEEGCELQQPATEAEVDRHRKALRDEALYMEHSPCTDEVHVISSPAHDLLASILCNISRFQLRCVQEQGSTFPSCTILLCRRNSCPHSWSLIFPTGWALPLWKALHFAGATAGGQREWQWTALHCRAASFPADFPDTASAAEFRDRLQGEEDAERAKRPNGKFRSKVVVDWTSVGSQWPKKGEPLQMSAT